MKVFATLATLLGFTYAEPSIQSMASSGLRSYSSDMMQRPSSMMEMSMDRQTDRPLSMSMMDRRQMSDRRMSSMYRDNAFGPNQYFLRDDFGNYDYGYANQNSERFEEGNGQGSVKGHYAYIDSNGMTRRVDYIADDQGFHILGDNNDRFKRSVEPDLVRTRMTSYMDASSLRDDGRDEMDRNMMGSNMRDRNIMDRNMMGSNMMDRNIMDRNMMGRDMMDRNMMDRNMMVHQIPSRNMYRIMSDRGMSSNIRDISRNNMLDNGMMRDNMMDNSMMRDNMMSRNMYSNNMMGRDMNSMMMGREMVGQDMSSDMNTMSQQMEVVGRFPELSNRFL